MKVCEIFTSIQGESSSAGLPCTFIRLSGCNLRCVFCDTQYSYEEGREMDLRDILRQVETAGVPLVEITGGEPLLQREETNALIGELLAREYEVLLETNGSMNIGGLDSRVTIILDMKTPGSGMSGRMDLTNLEKITRTGEVKFVLSCREDFIWAKEIVERYGLEKRCGVLFSPAFGLLSPRDLASWIIEERLRVRLNIQIHKYIFGPGERGV